MSKPHPTTGVPFPALARFRSPGRPVTGERRETITQAVHVGADYTDDDLQFLKAMDRYKREHKRPYPTWAEVLAVIKALGYRKVDAV